MKKLPPNYVTLSSEHLKQHLSVLKERTQKIHSLSALISRELKHRNRQLSNIKTT